MAVFISSQCSITRRSKEDIYGRLLSSLIARSKKRNASSKATNNSANYCVVCSSSTSKNRGSAVAVRMPRRRTTTINSIIVKPPCFADVFKFIVLVIILPTPCFIEPSKPTPVDCYSRLPIRESSPFPVNLWALARLFLFFVFVICSTHFERRYVTNVICFTIKLFSNPRVSRFASQLCNHQN